MAAGRNFLFVPGPTNVPERVTRAMMISMEDHRSPIFPELARACLTGLKPIFKTTTGTPFIFPSSGTGCWEAALTNCLNAGDKVLASRFGQFSHLWIDMCQRLGYEVEILETPWGEGAPVERYLASLSADKQHKIKAERDGDRRDQRRRRRAPGHGQPQASGLSFRRFGERAREHRLSHG
jgi:alanine-glyoxylate transaminase/serine-glyoxylate transaminase/serine-pyruvate transaminase